MKRALCLIMAFMTAIVPIAVHAEGELETSVSVQGDSIVISGTADVWENTDMSLIVLMPDRNLDELTEGNIKDIIAYQNQTEADADGKFTFDFKMSGSHAVYTYRVDASGYKMSAAGTFEYFGSGYVTEKVGEINTAKENVLKPDNTPEQTAAALAQMKSTIEGNLLPLNIGGGHYSDYIAANPDDTEIYMYAAKMGAAGNAETLKKQLDEAALLIAVKNAADDAAAQTAAEKILTEYAAENTAYSKTFKDTKILTSEQKKSICGSFIGREIYSISDFVDKITSDIILTAANTAESYGELQRTLLDNKDLIGFTKMSDYEKLKNKEKVFMELLGTATETGFTSLGDIKKKTDDEIANQKKKQSSGSSGGSGGGSGSSGSSFGGGGSAIISGGTANVTAPVQTPSQNTDFDDMAGFEWASEAVNFLRDKKIVSGTDGKNFKPNGLVTREEFLKMTVLALNMLDASAEVDFADVSKDDWFYTYTASAVKRGIINGISEDMFGAGMPITREDMSVIIYRAALAAGHSISGSGAEFADTELMPEYAAEAVGALSANGIINGMDGGRFGFGEYSTRAQAAVIIYRLIKLLNMA